MQNHNRARTTAAALLAVSALALTACQTTEVKESETASAPPAAPPSDQWAMAPVGTTWAGVRNGEPVTFTLVSRVDGIETVNFGDCTFTRWEGDPFAPVLSWNECSGNTGSREVSRDGDVFPLEVGKRWEYKEDGRSSNGNEWTNTRECKVTGTGAWTLNGKPVSTYEVSCRDRWRTRDFSVVPAAGTVVQFENRHRTRGEVTRTEIARVNLAT